MTVLSLPTKWVFESKVYWKSVCEKSVAQGIRSALHTDNVFLFIPNLIDYVRLLLLASFCVYAASGNYVIAATSYVLSFALDELDGNSARLLKQTSEFGMLLDILIDEASVTCLCMVLCTIYPRYLVAFQLFSTLDFVAQWAAYHYAARYRNNVYYQTGHRLLDLYFNNYVMTLVWVYGNHIFLLMLYVCNSTTGPIVSLFGTSIGLWKLIAYLTAPWSISRLCIMVYLLVFSMYNIAYQDWIRNQNIRHRITVVPNGHCSSEKSE